MSALRKAGCLWLIVALMALMILPELVPYLVLAGAAVLALVLSLTLVFWGAGLVRGGAKGSSRSFNQEAFSKRVRECFPEQEHGWDLVIAREDQVLARLDDIEYDLLTRQV